MRLTQLLAEGGVGSTPVVEIDGVGERTGGDGDTSDGYSGRILHGRDSESGVAGDGRSRVQTPQRAIEARPNGW